jgi:transglutaminase-like putative cysteine protease
MEAYPPAPETKLELALRIGCRLQFDVPFETPTLLNIKPRHDSYQMIAQERLEFSPMLPTAEFVDDHGNSVLRFSLQPGRNTLVYDAIAYVPAVAEDFAHFDSPIAPQHLPAHLLRYTLPSRYCDSDKLRSFAWQNFGGYPPGLARVQAICDWVHQNIEYRTGSGSPELSASDIIARGYGVCRDFAHCGVTLCRALNLPTRYVSGYVPDIGCLDPGTPMDFHAYFEVYLGGRWQVFDARFNTPRIGRVRISTGYDASSCAISTSYGLADLTSFEVWSYQVDPSQVRVGDPVDLSHRLCGTPAIRRPAEFLAIAA